jgi:hypothetical protein
MPCNGLWAMYCTRTRVAGHEGLLLLRVVAQHTTRPRYNGPSVPVLSHN